MHILSKKSSIDRQLEMIAPILKSNCATERRGQLQYLKTRMERQFDASGEITYILPAFPFKSPNNSQVICVHKSDGAEIEALKTLARLLDERTKIIIATDSWIFFDLYDFNYNGCAMNVKKESVLQNAKGLSDALSYIDASLPGAAERIRLVVERELSGFDNLRGSISEFLNREVEKRKPTFKPNRYKRHQICGMQNTMARVFAPVLCKMDEKVRVQLLNERAISAIIRTDIHQECIQRTFPEAIRLSVHRHFGFEKIGLFLVGMSNIAPWNGALLEKKDSGFEISYRIDAEKRGELVEKQVSGALSHSRYVEQ
ncbi:MAG: L-tyrosine/L-tryptophan isonitrile synthase family protein [Candidatus Micrarchaeota archaeon]|nr:L-tyrosine/L-tryptophan isonitrile synthase family protein [Candidatus Micrarchaeota archaeon]